MSLEVPPHRVTMLPAWRWWAIRVGLAHVVLLAGMCWMEPSHIGFPPYESGNPNEPHWLAYGFPFQVLLFRDDFPAFGVKASWKVNWLGYAFSFCVCFALACFLIRLWYDYFRFFDRLAEYRQLSR